MEKERWKHGWIDRNTQFIPNNIVWLSSMYRLSTYTMVVLPTFSSPEKSSIILIRATFVRLYVFRGFQFVFLAFFPISFSQTWKCHGLCVSFYSFLLLSSFLIFAFSRFNFLYFIYSIFVHQAFQLVWTPDWSSLLCFCWSSRFGFFLWGFLRERKLFISLFFLFN